MTWPTKLGEKKSQRKICKTWSKWNAFSYNCLTYVCKLVYRSQLPVMSHSLTGTINIIIMQICAITILSFCSQNKLSLALTYLAFFSLLRICLKNSTLMPVSLPLLHNCSYFWKWKSNNWGSNTILRWKWIHSKCLCVLYVSNIYSCIK